MKKNICKIWPKDWLLISHNLWKKYMDKHIEDISRKYHEKDISKEKEMNNIFWNEKKISDSKDTNFSKNF